MLRQLGGHRPDRRGVVGEVVAEAAVELKLDEAGGQQQPLGVDHLRVGRAGQVLGRADRNDAIAVRQHRAAFDALGGGIDGGVGDVKHGFFLTLGNDQLELGEYRLARTPDCWRLTPVSTSDQSSCALFRQFQHTLADIIGEPHSAFTQTVDVRLNLGNQTEGLGHQQDSQSSPD